MKKKIKYKKFVALLQKANEITDTKKRAAEIKRLKAKYQVVDDKTGQKVEIDVVTLSTDEPKAKAEGDEDDEDDVETEDDEAEETDAEDDEDNVEEEEDLDDDEDEMKDDEPESGKSGKTKKAKKKSTADGGDDNANDVAEAMVNRIVKRVLNVQTRRQPAPQVRTIALVNAKAHASSAAPTKFTIPAEVKRIRVKHFKGEIEGRSAEERAFRFGQMILARVSKKFPDRYSFTKAVDFVQAQKLHRGGDNGSGGLWIPEEFGTDLIDLRETFGVIRNLFKVVQMSAETRTDPRRKSGLSAYFVADGGAGTESNKGWDEVRLVAKELMVLSRYTANLEADAVISIGDDLAGEIGYAYAMKEDDCGLNGDATATYGGITGIRTRLAAATASLQVQAAGNTWDAITLADFNKLVGKLPMYADSTDAQWVCHKAFYAGVMQKLELAAGGVTSFEIQQGDRRPRPMFLGYPVQFAQMMPGATAVAQIPVMLGDFKKAATFGDRQAEEIAFSEEATVGGESLFERKQIAIRGTERFDINVHDVGDATNIGPVVALQTGA